MTEVISYPRASVSCMDYFSNMLYLLMTAFTVLYLVITKGRCMASSVASRCTIEDYPQFSFVSLFWAAFPMLVKSRLPDLSHSLLSPVTSHLNIISLRESLSKTTVFFFISRKVSSGSHCCLVCPYSFIL